MHTLLFAVALTASLITRGPGPADSTSRAAIAPRLADLRLDAMRPGDRLRLPLPGAPIATVTRCAEPRGGTTIVRCDLPPRGTVVLAGADDAISGFVSTGDGRLTRIRRAASDLAFAIDVQRDRWTGCAGAAGLPSQSRPQDGGPAGGCDEAPVIDVLVAYGTAALEAAGGVAAIEAEIALMIEYSNISLEQSALSARLNLVYAWHLDYGSEPGISLQELADPSDGAVDGIHALRDAYGADQVVLMIPGYFGVAIGLTDLEPQSAATGFSICGLDASPIVLAHEIGHNLGCCHSLGQGGGCPEEGGLLFPFSNGYVFPAGDGTYHGTVMAGGMLRHFSNPDVSYEGEPTGLNPIFDHPGADNALTITLSAPTVAGWRCNDGICEGLDLPSDAADCDGNGVPDACDIARGAVDDVDANGVPDTCACPGDVDGDGTVGADDLVAVLLDWGRSESPADVWSDGLVDVDDLLLVITAWGDCPTT